MESGMFQPRPTAFESMYRYPVEYGARDDVDVPNYSCYQQGPPVPFGGLGPGPGPGRGPGSGVLQGHGQGPGVGVGVGVGVGADVGGAGLAPAPGSLGVALGSGDAPLLLSYHFNSSDIEAAAILFNHSSQQHLDQINNTIAHNLKMKSGPAQQDDLAAQEAAAREYQPQLKGPFVGDKTPSEAIAQEYAKADPVYVAKTMALPETYSHYRPILGDGNCGWRAIGFSYFELLIQQGNPDLLNQELQRFTQLHDFLANVGGFDMYMFEDMIEETMILFRELSASLADPDMAAAILISKFNTQEFSNAFIYHLRLLAAACLRGNPGPYEAFCEAGIEGYCKELLVPDREIEQLGIMLLVDILLKPVGFVLEIAYLDRSPGNEVNVYRFPIETTGQDPSTLGPFMYLLYRPDHYDILYHHSQPQLNLRDPLANPLTNLQAHRVAFQEPQSEVAGPSYGTYDLDISPLTQLPQLGPPPMGALGPMSDYSPSPQSNWFAEPTYVDTPGATPSEQQDSPSPAAGGQPLFAQPPGSPTTIRFSRYQWQNAIDGNWPEQQTFQTNTFKNSHFNVAHYNNPHFQPEEYRPGVDDVYERAERPPRKKSHGKASGHSP